MKQGEIEAEMTHFPLDCGEGSLAWLLQTGQCAWDQ